MANILIVDDKESNLVALRKALKEVDAEIIKALSGEDALLSCLNHDFALAILDVQMPDMDGYELATLLRGDERTRHVPIIFVSAVYMADPYIFKGYSSGAVDFITKPFKPEILLSKVKVFLELDARKIEIMRQKDSLEKLVVQLKEQIEARKRAEQELMKARMLEAMGTLAGGIAHDFNNMLMDILGKIELARISGENPDKVDTLLEKAKKTILGATELTGKFITFSGNGKPSTQVIRVEQLVTRSVVSALNGFNIGYDFYFQEGLWDIEADPAKMNQVIFILVTNAREAMPHGGTLKIRAKNREVEPQDEATGLAIKEGAYVNVSITDQGPGIAAEHLEKIFDPYFSTKLRGNVKGMGLGLAIAHSIVTRHGGYIRAHSDGGAGASFHLYLPALKHHRAAREHSDDTSGESTLSPKN